MAYKTKDSTKHSTLIHQMTFINSALHSITALHHLPLIYWSSMFILV
ncbi:Putative uncharacterized protein [Moritella viscosa]|uniref:Uncharacterized protein n=1 Tax=Moritella viscosa TaxID=80854 RepID=A0A1K9Z0Y4_9GAMM|nr:Putative uncharacterized protein [Moritella viscosa]SHO00611.1 Putative uncharacterized protein [Moritella viscosa]SHO00912.1 Putative uncharacterized protein [Moritella viscosa]SHO01500.1 Putative uncharacterized protein [Moritella viscosa]SHO02333.1 Putative uncharacterized protein [Moritella viscosa]